MSAALASRFLSTVPPGESSKILLNCILKRFGVGEFRLGGQLAERSKDGQEPGMFQDQEDGQ